MAAAAQLRQSLMMRSHGLSFCAYPIRIGEEPQRKNPPTSQSGKQDLFARHLLAKNAAIFSFKNLPSAALLAAPAVCPHGDGIGTSDTPGINPASYFPSPSGKYKSVSDGIYKKGALIERSAFSTSPPNPGVPPTSCFSQVRICRIKLFASAPGIKFVR